MHTATSSRSHSPFRLALLLLLIACAGGARADEFDIYHPDEHYRRLGFAAWEEGRGDEAVRYLKRSARYADKGAQLGLAFMHLEGTPSQAPDAAAAYAWADLAAERGYREMLKVRERIWTSLDAAQQERAKEIGAGLYAEYGDDVAKPRLEKLLRAGLMKKTGTRTGSNTSAVGVARIGPAERAAWLAQMGSHPSASGAQGPSLQLGHLYNALTGHADPYYYSDANWRPEQYWQSKDRLWRKLEGAVEIAPIQPIDRS